MKDASDKIPLDAKLLSYAIIELNISRRNVAIYPRDHPSVERSLNSAYKFLNQLFEIRPEITLAIAKDTIIIDKYHLDKKNPVYREFALTLNKMNIAYITFRAGITKKELYSFHSFLTRKEDDLTVENLNDVFRKYNTVHIVIGAMDYRKFSAGDRASVQKKGNVSVWERYIYGLLEGRLLSGPLSDEIRDIPPEILAKILNNASAKDFKAEAYDRVITEYMRSSSENIFSDKDLKKLLEFINRLRPDLKQQFLSSAVKTFSKNINSAHDALKKISVAEIEGFLNVINKERIVVPKPLMDIIDKLSYSGEGSPDAISIEEDEFDDEDLLPSSLADYFNRDIDNKDAGALASDDDLREIQSLLNFEASELKTSQLMEFDSEFNDDLAEKRFNLILIEMIGYENVSEEEYRSFLNILREQSEQFLCIGEFGQILDILGAIELNRKGNIFPPLNSDALEYYHSAEFITQVVDSFTILGRENKKEVSMICAYYDKKVIPYLMDALAEEESLAVRRFLMDLLKQFGDKVIHEALQRLADERWFVKRNMLYILAETSSREVIENIKPLCRHENLKVSMPAIKCLLNNGDDYAKEIIREYIDHKSGDFFEQALNLAGSFRIKEVVDDLIRLLNKKEISGDDLLNKIPVVRALGDIGDPRALDAFRGLLSRKSILFRKMVEQLRVEIYKTLKNYPYDLVRDLVEAGLESGNETIKGESLSLFREKAK
jgi:histone H3/H4